MILWQNKYYYLLLFDTPLIPSPSSFSSLHQQTSWKEAISFLNLVISQTKAKTCFHYFPTNSHIVWMVHVVDSSLSSEVMFFF